MTDDNEMTDAELDAELDREEEKRRRWKRAVDKLRAEGKLPPPTPREPPHPLKALAIAEYMRRLQSRHIFTLTDINRETGQFVGFGDESVGADVVIEALVTQHGTRLRTILEKTKSIVLVWNDGDQEVQVSATLAYRGDDDPLGDDKFMRFTLPFPKGLGLPTRGDRQP